MSFNFLVYIAMEHEQQPHQKKHFSEEETLDKAEKKVDDVMGKITKKWDRLTQRFLNASWFKNILNFPMVTEANKKLQPYLKIIFMVIGWISLVAWIIGVFSFLISLSGLGFMFSLWVGIGLRVLIYIFIALAFSLISLLTGIGMLRGKKRVVPLVIFGIAVCVFSLVVSIIPVGLYSYKSYGSFWGSLFNLLLTFVLLLFVVKNQQMFTK